MVGNTLPLNIETQENFESRFPDSLKFVQIRKI